MWLPQRVTSEIVSLLPAAPWPDAKLRRHPLLYAAAARCHLGWRRDGGDSGRECPQPLTHLVRWSLSNSIRHTTQIGSLPTYVTFKHIEQRKSGKDLCEAGV